MDSPRGQSDQRKRGGAKSRRTALFYSFLLAVLPCFAQAVDWSWLVGMRWSSWEKLPAVGMRSFDAFARPVQEFQVKTAIGGYISIGSLCLVLALFFAELRYFLTPEAKDEMLIDQNQDRKYLNISLDISFSSLPCAALSLNLLDPKGNNVMHVAHEIYKQRRSKTGQSLGKPIRDSLQNVAATPAQLVAASLPEKGGSSNHSTRSLRCASCFQSHIDEDDCCPSCKDVQASFLSRGWDDRPDNFVFGWLSSSPANLKFLNGLALLSGEISKDHPKLKQMR